MNAHIRSLAQEPAPHSDETPLVVHFEDDQIVRQVIAAVCQAHGVEYVGTDQWSDLMTQFGLGSSSRKKMLVSDLELPGMPLKNILVPLFRHFPSLPVAFFTGNPMGALNFLEATRKEFPQLEQRTLKIQVIAKNKRDELVAVIQRFSKEQV